MADQVLNLVDGAVGDVGLAQAGHQNGPLESGKYALDDRMQRGTICIARRIVRVFRLARELRAQKNALAEPEPFPLILHGDDDLRPVSNLEGTVRSNERVAEASPWGGALPDSSYTDMKTLIQSVMESGLLDM